tara:strand:- start:175 stop:465 length:291 start_codon:yes stop_codon:yes gene_type:complete
MRADQCGRLWTPAKKSCRPSFESLRFIVGKKHDNVNTLSQTLDFVNVNFKIAHIDSGEWSLPHRQEYPEMGGYCDFQIGMQYRVHDCGSDMLGHFH